MTNTTTESIHPPSIILTAEVHRENFKNNIKHESENHIASDTVTTMTNGTSSSISSSESGQLSSGSSAPMDSNSQKDDDNVLLWAQRAIQGAIDQHTTTTATTPPPGDAVRALIHKRQQHVRPQPLRIPPPPSANDHPSDESAQVAKHRRTVHTSSPTIAKEHSRAKKSIILSHHIDRSAHSTSGSLLPSRNDTTVDLPEHVAQVDPDDDNTAISNRTPDTSRCSSPSVSVGGDENTGNFDFENCRTIDQVVVVEEPKSSAVEAEDMANQNGTIDRKDEHVVAGQPPVSKDQDRYDNTNSLVDDMTLESSQVCEVNIDANTMNYVTSSVRDYIDSMHSTTQQYDSRIDNDGQFNGRFHQAKEVEPLQIDTKSYDLPAGSLIEYLSAKASTKHERKSFGMDPPVSSSEDDVMKNDPPLVLTHSEMTRSAVVEPEVNPLKKNSSTDVQENGSARTDPDELKPVIMYDNLGEKCRTIENTKLTCDTTTTTLTSSNQSLSERVIDTPQRKTTVVTIPNLNFIDPRNEIRTNDTFEPDGLYPSREARDFASCIQHMHYLLSGTDDVEDIDIQQFGKLVQFSSTFIGPHLHVSSYGTSQIMTLATKLNVSIPVTDRYLDALRSMGDDESQRCYNDLENLNRLTQFLRELNAYLEVLTGSNVRIEASGAETASSLPIVRSVSIDAFEVEANDGFTNADFRPVDDEEPWWEVVARLNGTVCQDSQSCQQINSANTCNQEPVTLSNVNASKVESTNALEKDDATVSPIYPVERDIAKFWIERERAARQPEVYNLPDVGSLVVTKAHSYSGQDITARCGRSKRISKTKSSSSSYSNMSQRSLRSIQRKWAGQKKIAQSIEDAPKLNAVSATSAFFDKDNKLKIFNSFSNVWRLSYVERAQHHEGYFNVDKYSLYAASAVQTFRHPLDCVAWESRSVKQRFMYEHSISFTRNWFGCLTETNANDIIKEPICRPKSMEMPMEADEWTEEWFLNRHRLCHDREYHQYDDDDDSFWDGERPECGTIRNVRLRIGEKITRVTPDLTSHVRRSRWRKKHFPPGTFPYN